MTDIITHDQFSDRIYSASEGYRAVASTNNGSIGSMFTSRANVRVREPYDRSDYDRYRPSESQLWSLRDIISKSDEYYHNVGIVRNIIDLMADFAVKGIKWKHTNRQVEAFMNRWFETVNGFHVSERFCNYLLRRGNNCIYTNMSTIKESTLKDWRKTRGAEFENLPVKSLVIPSGYVYLDILSLVPQKLKDGKTVYTMNTPFTGSQTGRLNGQFQDRYASYIPADLSKEIKRGVTLVLDDSKIKLFHYKKDDWKLWAEPIIASVLDPLQALDKMHLADMSALDGAISNIRLWRVGYLDPTNINNSFIPNKPMIDKIADLIYNHVGGGVLDLVMGPEVDFKESSTQVHQFLGHEKYLQIMSEIYEGFGIPPSLAGGASGAAGGVGFTNNFISMKVLVERLNYVRTQLKSFWNNESRQIQRAMGFSYPAKLHFDDAILADEANYKKLLVDLYDRNVISRETIRTEFNILDNIETSRVRREMKREDADRDPQRSGPYSNPLWKKSFLAELIKGGKVDPEVLGLDIDIQDDVGAPDSGNPGGRPIGAKDQGKRKRKIVTPRVTAEQFYKEYNGAKEAFQIVSDVVTPIFLRSHSKQFVRELTLDETQSLEDFKLAVLCSCKDEDYSAESIVEVFPYIVDSAVERQIRDSIIENKGEKITVAEKRDAACAAFVLAKLTKNN